MEDEAARGEIVLGGCCLSMSDHRFECPRCGRRWGGLDPADEDVARHFTEAIDADLPFWLAMPEGPLRRAEQIIGSGDPSSFTIGRTISDDVIDQLVIGDPSLVVVSRLADGLVEVDAYAEVPIGDTTWVPIRRGVSPLFVPPQYSDEVTRVAELIATYIGMMSARRRRSFRRCRTCDRPVPPEERVPTGQCYGCAAVDHDLEISWSTPSSSDHWSD